MKGVRLCGFGGWIGRPVEVAARRATFLGWRIRVRVGLFTRRGSGSKLDGWYLGNEIIDWRVFTSLVVLLHLGYDLLQALKFIVELGDTFLIAMYRFSY